MSVNWIRLSKEIAQMPGGIAMLRVLQAHGITRLDQFEGQELKACCTLDMVIDYAHKEK